MTLCDKRWWVSRKVTLTKISMGWWKKNGHNKMCRRCISKICIYIYIYFSLAIVLQSSLKTMNYEAENWILGQACKMAWEFPSQTHFLYLSVDLFASKMIWFLPTYLLRPKKCRSRCWDDWPCPNHYAKIALRLPFVCKSPFRTIIYTKLWFI